MPQVLMPNGNVVSVLGAVSACAECGQEMLDTTCEVCGWVDVPEEKPVPNRMEEPKPPQSVKSPPSIVDHIDVNDDACQICGGNRDEVGGVLQCIMCGPQSSEEVESRKVTPFVRQLPNIDGLLPDDLRCPKCLEMAAGSRADNPVEIGEPYIEVDFLNPGAVALVCPLCDYRKSLVGEDKREVATPNAQTTADETTWETAQQTAAVSADKEKVNEPVNESVNEPVMTAVEPAPRTAPFVVEQPSDRQSDRPPLEVRRRKKGA